MSSRPAIGLLVLAALGAGCGDDASSPADASAPSGADAAQDLAAGDATPANASDASREVNPAPAVILPAMARVPVGQTVQYEAYVDLVDGARSVTLVTTWSVEPAGIADIAPPTLQAGALLTARQLGKAKVVATLSGGVRVETDLEVIDRPLTSVTLTNPGRSLLVGGTVPLQAMATYEGGMTADVTDQAIWRSADARVATVSNVLGKRGVATAIGAGTTTLTASFAGKEGSAPLTVDDSMLQMRLVITPASQQKMVLESFKFGAQIIYPAGTTEDVSGTATWMTSDAKVAVVASNGLGACSAPGTITISATAKGATGTAQLTCVGSGPVVTGLQIRPVDHQAKVGDKVLYMTTAFLADGTSQDATVETDFSAAKREVATFGTNDARAVGIGQTTITASFRGVTTTTTLSVSAP